MNKRCPDSNSITFVYWCKLEHVPETSPGTKQKEKIMKPQNYKKLIALAAFVLCIATTGFANGAFAAGFGVKIDCHGDDGYPRWSESNGPIIITAQVNNAWITLTRNLVITNSMCTVEDGVFVTYPAFSWDIVQKIKIENTSTDGLFMDRVFLTNSSGTIKDSWGVDNNIGYCLSTEAEDPESWAYCWNATFYPSRTFTP